MSNIVVGLDIGTSFIRCVIGQLDEENRMQVIGAAKKPSKGLRNGVIVNIDAAVSAIKETLEAAELMAGVIVTSVFSAIGGSQVEGRSSSGGVAVDTTRHNRRMEISDDTKDRAIEAARAIVPPLGKQTLHVIPQEYTIDEVPGFKEPIGSLGVRLDVSVYIVSASVTVCSNLDLCVKRAGLNLDGVMLKTLAASIATLHEEEMELGSILIDLGADSTDVMVIYKGSPTYITSIPVGGNFVTNDIVQVKGIPFADAEQIKINSGSCWIEGSEADEEVIIREIGARPAEQTTRYELCEIIQPRMEEIMSMAKREVVRHSGLKQLNGSIVLTGGGALMHGIVQLAQSVWRTTSVRVGECPDMGALPESNGYFYRSCDFATVTGLMLANKKNAGKEKSRRVRVKRDDDGSIAEGIGTKMKAFFKKFF
ncbi:MAG: cell division protein FtsA [Treponema sp.]|nr:cell division protein FtsA [Treponema sp.]